MKYVKYQADFLVQWNKRMCIDRTEPLVDKVVEAVLHEQQIPFKHTSEYRNIYSYDKLWLQLENYNSEYVRSVEDPHLKAGLKVAFRNFAKPKGMDYLSSVNLMAEAQQLFSALGIKRTTAAGLTAYGETKFEAFSTGLEKAVKIVKDGKSPSPCLAGVRTQRKGKTRLVWGYPLEMTILEAVVARPLIDYFKGTNHLMTFGRTSHEIGMRIRKSASNTRHHLSIDYSKFDSSVSPLFIRHAFNAFRSWFDGKELVYGNYTVSEVFDLIEGYFIHTPLVMPNRDKKYPTLVLGKKGGVPSGSYFTQLVDSFTNAALIFAVSSKFQLGLKDENVNVLGDDCLVFINREIDLGLVSNYVRKLGFKMNPAKGSSGPSNSRIEYLGRQWKNGFPIRTYDEAVRGALYPEKFRKYNEMRGIRRMEALNVLNSYLLTSYVEDAPVGINKFGEVTIPTGRYVSGLTKFLMSEGLIPGKVLKRAIY